MGGRNEDGVSRKEVFKYRTENTTVRPRCGGGLFTLTRTRFTETGHRQIRLYGKTAQRQDGTMTNARQLMFDGFYAIHN